MTEPKTEIAHISTPKAHYTLDFGSGTLQVKPIITNADRIRAMSDEELAEWIAHPKISYCQHDICNGETDCAECALVWLKQEATE